MFRYCLGLIALLIAVPAWGTTLYLRTTAGGVPDCAGTDERMNTSAGSSATTWRLDADGSGKSWTIINQNQTLNGSWGCTMNVDVSAGGGGPNTITITVERVNTSCVSQETIFTEESGTLTKGATTDYTCTGASKSVTFGNNEYIKVIVYQSGGTRDIDLNYDGADPDDSLITIPDAATPTPTASPTATTTPTLSPTISPTISPTQSPTVSPTISPTISPTATATVSPTISPTNTPTSTPTATPALDVMLITRNEETP